MVVMVVAFPSLAVAHDGLIDSRGCHTDNDGTNYHCHPERLEAEKSASVTLGEDGDEEKKTLQRNKHQNHVNLFPPTVPQSTNSEASNNTSKNLPKYNQEKAKFAFEWSTALITLTTGFGSTIAMLSALEDEYGDPMRAFGVTALPSMYIGMLAASYYSTQAGYESPSRHFGAFLVVLSSMIPLAIGAIY